MSQDGKGDSNNEQLEEEQARVVRDMQQRHGADRQYTKEQVALELRIQVCPNIDALLQIIN